MDNTNNAAVLRETLERIAEIARSYATVKDCGQPICDPKLMRIFEDNARTALATPQRNCDRIDIRTPWDAVIAWADATDPEYAAHIREHEDDWEPARYEWEQIVEWLLAPAEQCVEKRTQQLPSLQTSFLSPSQSAPWDFPRCAIDRKTKENKYDI